MVLRLEWTFWLFFKASHSHAAFSLTLSAFGVKYLRSSRSVPKRPLNNAASRFISLVRGQVLDQFWEWQQSLCRQDVWCCRKVPQEQIWLSGILILSWWCCLNRKTCILSLRTFNRKAEKYKHERKFRQHWIWYWWTY